MVLGYIVFGLIAVVVLGFFVLELVGIVRDVKKKKLKKEELKKNFSPSKDSKND